MEVLVVSVDVDFCCVFVVDDVFLDLVVYEDAGLVVPVLFDLVVECGGFGFG